MNSLPARRRGSGAGMVSTFQNSGMVLSIGVFFTLIITGLAASLPAEVFGGLVQQGVPAAVAGPISHLPPTATVFSALLGYNPMQSLLGPALGHLPAAKAAFLTGKSFFPNLISAAFSKGLDRAFYFAMAASLIAALASALRGGKYHHVEAATRTAEVGDSEMALKAEPKV